MDNFHLTFQEVVAIMVQTVKKPDRVWLDDDLCCYLTDLLKVYKRNFNGVQKNMVVPRDVLCNTVINVTYIKNYDLIYVATEQSLFLIKIEPYSFCYAYAYPTPAIRITCWNPGQSLLVVIDEEWTMRSYQLKSVESHEDQYELIACETASFHGDPPPLIYVGWGTESAQFKGIKREKSPVTSEIPQPSSPPRISWHKSGEKFVVNYWTDRGRFLKVFSSSLIILHKSAPHSGLLSSVSFDSTGHYIICAAISREMNRLVVFEGNCRVKSEFAMPDSKGEIKDIQCHPELNIVGVHCQSEAGICLNIYMLVNETCYLKQQFDYPSMRDEALIKFHFIHDLNMQSCKVNILTTTSVKSYHYRIGPWGVHNNLVAVINGCDVHFTDFSEGVVAPPLATRTLHFERPVNQIQFFLSENSYLFNMSNKQSAQFRFEDRKLNQCAIFIDNETTNTVFSFDTEIEGIPYTISLTEHQQLMIGDSCRLNCVTSIYVYRTYLFFIHMICGSCRLYTVRIAPDLLMNFELEDYMSREVEQGGKIICVNDKCQVILIMPRGNLETVTCRLLIIDAVELLLNTNHWTEAINLIRKERVNWNLLIDLNSQRFIDNVQDFIEGVKCSSLLSKIVSEFSSENCFSTMYSKYTKQCDILKRRPAVPKLEVFKAILNALSENSLRNILSIVTLQVKHFSLKAGVQSILQIFQKGFQAISGMALAKLLSYTDSKRIINAAYTLYDLNFLTFVYRRCSEDPMVFLPEIEELRNLTEIERRFEMNVCGNDYVNATKYLVLMEQKSVDEIADFVNRHETHLEAYESVTERDYHFMAVSHLYANWLTLKGKNLEAGIIFELAKLYDEALICFKFALHYQKVISLLNVVNMDHEQKMQCLRSLADDLGKNGREDDAAVVLQWWCNDYKAAISVLLKNCSFYKALCIAEQQNDQLEIDEHIRPQLQLFSDELYFKITNLVAEFDLFKQRLLIVRKNKLTKFLMERQTQQNENLNDDTNSEFGSLVSGTSRTGSSSITSAGTSRTRRKLERKRLNMREGGPFEDIALIRQLHMGITNILRLGPEVWEVCRSLVSQRRDNFPRARELQNHLEQAQRVVVAAIPVIWTPEFLAGDYMSTDPAILSVTENWQELDEQYRTFPPIGTSLEDWKLGLFD